MLICAHPLGMCRAHRNVLPKMMLWRGAGRLPSGGIYIMFAREGSTGLCWNAVGAVRIGAAPARRGLDDVLWNVLCTTIASGVKQ